MWVKTYGTTLSATPGTKPGEYTPIPPVWLSGIRANQLVFRASSTKVKPNWYKAFVVVQFVNLPGEVFTPAEAMRQTIPLNQTILIEPVTSPSYSLKFEIPWWIPELLIEMWEGSAEGGAIAGNGAAEAATPIERGQTLYLRSDGRADLAQAHTLATGAIVGFAATAAAAGVSVSYFTEGVLDMPDWSTVTGSPSLSPGGVYYLSSDQPGKISLYPPDTEGLLVVRVGTALSNTALDIEVQPSILL